MQGSVAAARIVEVFKAGGKPLHRSRPGCVGTTGVESTQSGPGRHSYHGQANPKCDSPLVRMTRVDPYISQG
jgi:hypothetical protein